LLPNAALLARRPSSSSSCASRLHSAAGTQDARQHIRVNQS
jgi:hypothetical protein